MSPARPSKDYAIASCAPCDRHVALLWVDFFFLFHHITFVGPSGADHPKQTLLPLRKILELIPTIIKLVSQYVETFNHLTKF